MNKKIKILLLVLFFLALLMLPHKSFAKDLDEILNYTTTVDPRDDGTLDIKYHIEWKVLDSTAEGPLKWVTIGIPNQHVDEIKKLTNNISNIKYMVDNGNYVRIDFAKSYNAGEVAEFEFSLHQSYMYSLDNSKGKITYEFTPGWFSDIKVDQAVIQWKADNIKKHNGKTNGSYIVWKKKLGKGKKITAKVEYSVSNFQLDYVTEKDNKTTIGSTKTSYSNQKNNGSSSFSAMFIGVMLIIVIALIIILQVVSPTPYYMHSGYGYYGRPFGFYHHDIFGGPPPRGGPYDGMFGGDSFGGGSDNSGSSCACACACAGGGRAGCAKKDFYGTNLKV